MATIDALWAAWEGPGVERLRLRVDGDGARADRVIIAPGAVRPLDGSDRTRWRFRSLDSGFTAELPVDAADLVRDRPGIARRLR